MGQRRSEQRDTQKKVLRGFVREEAQGGSWRGVGPLPFLTRSKHREVFPPHLSSVYAKERGKIPKFVGWF